jgi:hypothetical protein
VQVLTVPPPADSRDVYWNNSVQVGAICKRIANARGGQKIDLRIREMGAKLTYERRCNNGIAHKPKFGEYCNSPGIA